MCAISFADGPTRDVAVKACHENGLLVLPCGTDSLRFRPALTVTAAEVDEALGRLDESLASLSQTGAAA